MESSDRDMYRQFQDWCLRTYGDSGKTKTVTRKKYDRIVQLLNGSESSSTDNAKFKFWVKSKGFQLGNSDEVSGGAGGGKQVLYVPVKTTVSRELSSLFYVGRCSPLREREAQGEPQPQLAPSSLFPQVIITMLRLPVTLYTAEVFVGPFYLKRSCAQRAPPGRCRSAPRLPPRAAAAGSEWAIVPPPPLRPLCRAPPPRAAAPRRRRGWAAAHGVARLAQSQAWRPSVIWGGGWGWGVSPHIG